MKLSEKLREACNNVSDARVALYSAALGRPNLDSVAAAIVAKEKEIDARTNVFEQLLRSVDDLEQIRDRTYGTRGERSRWQGRR